MSAPVTALDKTMGALCEGTAASMRALWAAYTAGRIDAATFQTAAAALVAAANARGGMVGTLALAANLSARLGALVTPQPVKLPPHRANPGRLEKSLGTILATEDGSGAQVERLARAEPAAAVQDGYTSAIARSPLVEGWTRHLEIDACQLCTWWDREGRVWPKDHPMPTHPGCLCTPDPTLARDIQPTTARKRK